MTSLSPEEAREFGSRRWKTQNGDELSWSEMTPRHLRNAAAMVRRNTSQKLNALYSAACFFTGDAASYQIDREISSTEDQVMIRGLYADQMEAYANYKENP